ncbi:MAG: hypothetical protein ACRC1K_26315 [Planctomycetia bacterium]
MHIESAPVEMKTMPAAPEAKPAPAKTTFRRLPVEGSFSVVSARPVVVASN